MIPLVIAGCHGVLHPAAGRRGVVICGTLGDEALNLFRPQVFLAERLAEAGFPTLRIDYYSTGDSAGDDDTPRRFLAWIDSIAAAVLWLRTEFAVETVSLLGLRIGAALAARAACELDAIDALIMLAPVAGRRFLRELTLAARTTAEIWESRIAVDRDWFEAHGLRLDRLTRDALDSLEIGDPDIRSTARVLILDASGARNSHVLVSRLQATGVAVTHATCDGLDRMLKDSHENEIPEAAFALAVNWLGDAGSTPRAIECMFHNSADAVLDLGTAREIPVRFGDGDTLAGILTLPPRRNPTAPVVLIPGTGANPRRGNSRGAVELARWLAGHGVATLRMDGSGVGDAAPETGERGQPYAKQGDRDVLAGVDFLAAGFTGPIMVLGLCSGAYHAFQAALLDHRISGLVLVNLQKFVWHEGACLSVMQRTTFRTTRFYLSHLMSRDVWSRLPRGRVNVIGIGRALAGRAARHVVALADPAIAAVRGETRIGMVRRQLRELAARSVQILYVLSGNDPGLDEIDEYFGVRGWRLRSYRNVTFRRIDGADHTLSARWARHELRRHLAAYLRSGFGVAPETDAAFARTRLAPAEDRNLVAALPIVPPLPQ